MNIKKLLNIYKIYLQILILSTIVLSQNSLNKDLAVLGVVKKTVEHVILISIDGLRGKAITETGKDRLSNLYRIRIEGVYTDNARTDFDYTSTLLDHACILTGRSVLGEGGHNLTDNFDNGKTFKIVKKKYIAGVYDVVHDHGLKTAFFAGKSKFEFYERSWNSVNGREDIVDVDNGKDKIDMSVYNRKGHMLTRKFLSKMSRNHYNFTLLHLADPDVTGHTYGWHSDEYIESIVEMDALLGKIFDLIETDSILKNNTVLIITSDHGGYKRKHSDASEPNNYTIPFYVWGAGVACGVDLYQLNKLTRKDPNKERPDYEEEPQPVRNGDCANLALGFLGLPSVLGSVINEKQDLNVFGKNR